MTGRGWMGEVLNQVWLKSINKQVNAQKEKIFQGSRKLPRAHEKVSDENEELENKTMRSL